MMHLVDVQAGAEDFVAAAGETVVVNEES